MTRLEVIKQNLEALKENYEQAKKHNELNEIYWWEDETGFDLTDGIDCHVVFQGDPPCLCEERNCWDDTFKKQAACAECKAIWLMGEYE